MPLVTFLTDYGLKDTYVAEVKAVLLSQVPHLTIVDLTHDVPAHNVEAGAFQLLRSYSHFPAASFHLAVVDPGVGTPRRCLFARTALGSFVGPDNGLLKWAIEDAEKISKKKAQIFEIPMREAVRPTFYGRDVFAPFLATHIKGKKARLLRVDSLEGRSFPEAQFSDGAWEGEILSIDHFGNAVTSVLIESIASPKLRVGKKKISTAPNYLSISEGQCALIPGSHGFWEIAANQTSAAKLLKLRVRDRLALTSN